MTPIILAILFVIFLFFLYLDRKQHSDTIKHLVNELVKLKTFTLGKPETNPDAHARRVPPVPFHPDFGEGKEVAEKITDELRDILIETDEQSE